MAVKIRLRRMGNKNNPFFRIVVADSRSPTDGRFIETIGWYDPMKKGDVSFKVKLDRVEYWRGNGAQVSDTVANLVKRAARMQPPEAAAAAVEAPAEAEAVVAETAAAEA